jgi:hypothetical protein
MKVAGQSARPFRAPVASVKFAFGALALTGLVAASQAQAPYLLPYTIQVLAGGGTSVTVASGATSPCLGAGASGVQYDSFGDGCPVASTSVVAGAASDLHDVVVDQQGNVYFLDNNSSNGVVRRIDARSGLITVYAGSYVSQVGYCAATQDKYGDGCPSTDGKGNGGSINSSGTFVPSPTTSAIGKARGLGIDKQGNVYIADYTNSVAHKISAATGLMTMVAGSLASSTKLTSNGGAKGFSGDGGIAFNPAATPTPQGAALNADRGITATQYGDVFIADSTNNVIRLVYNGGPAAASLLALTNPGKTPTVGYIYTVVGSDATAPSAAPTGATGDGGLASAATLTTPEDVEVDINGNLFIGDFGNNKVRVVYAGGTLVKNLIALTNSGAVAQPGYLYTVVGGGAGTYTAPTQVLATSVPIGNPRKLTIDNHGNLFIADNTYNIIWFVDITTGYMRPIVGTYGATTDSALCATHTDNFGDNCPATTASLNPNSAMGVSVDAFDNLYIGDSGDQRLRKVNTNQVFPTTATGGTVTQTLEIHFAAGDSPAASNAYVISGSADFTAVSASSCTVNPDTTQDCLVNVTFAPSLPGTDTATLVVHSTLNGTATFGLSGVSTASAIAFDPGQTASFASSLNNPQGIAQDAAGNTYIADTANNRVLRFASAGTPVLVAGTGTASYTGDGAAATAATLNAPRAVAVTRSGIVYIADTGNNVVRQINPANGFISTVAGAGTGACTGANDTLGDGCLGTSATLKAPAGLAADPTGNVFVSDSGNNLIREITYSGYIYAFAGGASAVCASGDVFGNGCAPSAAIFSNPTGLAVDAAGDVFIADTGDSLVRKIAAATNTVTAIAGTGQAGSSGNGGAATGAQLSGPTGVGVDAAGNVYIADTGNSVVRLVNASGTINTSVGTLGSSGTGTLPGLATSVLLASPAGVVSNGAGSLVVLDSGNNRAISDTRTSVTYNFGRTNLGSTSPTLQIQETSTGNAATTLNSPLFTPTPSAPFSITPSTSNGCSASTSQSLTAGTSCLLIASFTPSASQLGSFSATYTENTTPTFTPAPFIALSGTGAVLTTTTSTTVVTNPATGSPQYSIPFTVTTTVKPASCNTAAPSCFPTGTVTFFVDGTQVGTPIPLSATATASQTISGLNVGSHTVTAVYNGDSFYASSSAAPLTITVARGSTTSAITLSPSSGLQFSAFNMSAQVTAATSNIPTGTFTFYAGATQIGIASIDARTGMATLLDTLQAAGSFTAAHYLNYGLNAGTYAITAVYSGDTNYAPSTSSAATLTITADPATFTVSLLPTSTGTGQGSTASIVATIIANNTFNGTVGFTCTNLPANSTCTFGPPSSLTFTSVPGIQTEQQINITIFTDVPSGVTQTTSELLGWPVLLFSMFGMLAFRRRLRQNPRALRLVSIAALFGLLAGGSIVMSGCSGTSTSGNLTPVGTYTINFVATSGSQTVTTPFTFAVGPGEAGEL